MYINFLNFVRLRFVLTLNVDKMWMCLVLLDGMGTKSSRTALSLDEGYEGGTIRLKAAVGRLLYLTPSAW